MGNLGKLWFDVDLNLGDLLGKLDTSKEQILKKLKIDVPIDAKSVEGVTSATKKAADESERKAKAEKIATEEAEKQAQATKKAADETDKMAQAQRIISNNFDKLKANAETLSNALGNIVSKGGALHLDMSGLSYAKKRVDELVEHLRSLKGSELSSFDLTELSSLFGKIRAEIADTVKSYKNLTNVTEKANKEDANSVDRAIKKQAELQVKLEKYRDTIAKAKLVNAPTMQLEQYARSLQNIINLLEQIRRNGGLTDNGKSFSDIINGTFGAARIKADQQERTIKQITDFMSKLQGKNGNGVADALNEYTKIIEQIGSLQKTASKAKDFGVDVSDINAKIAALEKYRQELELIATGKGQRTAAELRLDKSYQTAVAAGWNSQAITNNTIEKQKNAAATIHLSSTEQQLAASIKSSTEAARGQSQLLSDLKSLATQYLGVWGAQSFINNIIHTGGLLEQQRMSIGAILGDLSQANHLFGQIQQLALKSPFGVVQLDTMSKQLTAYNFNYSELYDWTKRLADISAATGTEVSRLALALGHVRSEGALSGYTLRQFAMGNVPLLQTLSKQLGKTTAEIRKMTREKAITYEDVEKALKALTDEGGIFANAQEVMSNALNAKFKNLSDAFDIMFGSMAESGVGDALKGIAETLTVLAKHWKEVGAQIIVVAGAMAASKAVQATVNAGLLRSGVMAGQYSAKQLELLATTGKLNRELLLQAVAAGKVSAADAEAAGAVYNLTRAQLDAVAATGKTAAAFDVAAIAGGKYATQTQIMASQFKSASWLSMTKWATGAKLAWMGLAGAIDTAKTAVRGFLATMWPLLAISAVTEVFMRMSQKSEELDNFLKDLSQTANEASKNLSKVTEDYSVGSSNGKDAKQLTEDIEEMVEQLKDYSENASETFKNAFAIDAEGKSVYSLAEQYEILAQALATAKKGYENLGEHSDIITNALDSVDWNHGKGKVMKFFGELGKFVGGWMFGDNFTAERGNLNEAIENYVNKVRDVRIAENELMQNRLSLTKALKAAGYEGLDYLSDKTIIGIASSMPTMFNEADRARVEGFWNNIGDSAKEALEKVKDSNAELYKAFELAGGKAEAAGTAIFKALAGEYGEDLTKWPKEWRDEVMTVLARVTAGVSGFADMSEEQQLRVRNAFLKPFGITLTLDNSEAEKRLTEMQIHLNDLVGKDWVVKLHLENVGSFEELYDQLDKTVKKSDDTIKKLGDGISKERRKEIEAFAESQVYYDTLIGEEKEYATAVRNRQKAVETANKKGWKLSSLEKKESTDARSQREQETKAEKEAKARTKQAEARLKIDEDLAKQRLELQDAIADAEVAAIENNAERERAQRELEFEKQKRQIEKQAEEWKKESYRLAKEQFDATNTDKSITFYDTATGKAGWEAMGLTEEQLAIYEARMKEWLAKRARWEEEDAREREKANREYINKYLLEYGNYAEKLKSIEENKEAEIADIRREYGKDMTDDEKAAMEARIKMVEKATEEEIEELNIKYGKAKAFMADFWGDTATKSIGEIDRIIKKYEALVKYFEGDKSVSRDSLINDFGFTEEELNRVSLQMVTGKKSTKDFVKQLKALKSELGQKSPWMQFKNNVEEALKKIKEASGENKGSQVGAGLSELGQAVQGITPELDSLAEGLSNVFDVDTGNMKQAIGLLRDFGSVLDGIGKIKQGDYAGGAISIIGAIGNFFSLLASADDGDHARVLQSIDTSIGESNKRMSRLTEALEEAYGIEAQNLAEKKREALAYKQGQLYRAIESDSQGFFHLGSIAIYRYLGKSPEEALAVNSLSKVLKDYDGDSLAQLLYEIRETSQELWSMIMDSSWGEYAEQLADTVDELKDINIEEKVKITGTSFEDVVNDMIDSLYDLADGSEEATNEVAENFEKMMNRMVINNVLRTRLEAELRKWYETWYEAYNGDKAISDAEREQLKNDYLNIWNSYAAEVQALKDSGILNPLPTDEEQEEEAKDYFDQIRNAWIDTVSAMEGDAEGLGKEIARIMFEAFVKNKVFNEDFDAWLTDWMAKYEAAMGVSAPGERDARLRQLEEEKAKKVAELTQKTKQYADMTGYAAESTDELSTSLENLSDTLLDALLDTEKDAAQVGKEIGQTLIKEMLAEMLATGKYADQIAAIKGIWQSILSVSEQGWWSDREGVLEGKAGAVYNINDAIDLLIAKINQLNNDIAEVDAISKLTDKYAEFGKEAEKAAEEAESAFKDLRSTFVDALTDMEGSYNSFRKKLEETAIRDLMEKTVLDAPFSAGLDGLVKDFTGIDDYIAQWTELYEAAAKAGETELIDALLDELSAVFELTEEKAKELRERLKEVTRDTTFTDMEDSFVSALMDMDGDIMDFAKDMKKTIVQNLVEAFMVSDKIRPMLEELQKTFDFVMGQKGWTNEERINFMSQGGTIDGEEYKGLDEYNDDMKAMYETAQGLLAYFGIVKTETDELLGSITSNITSMLTDGESTAKDFAASLKESIVNSLIDAYTASEDFQQGLAEVKRQMEEAIKSGAPDRIKAAEEAAKEFWGETTEGVKQYTDALEKAQQEQDSTFKDMTDTWVSSLMDFNATAEDWAEELGRTMARKIIEQMVVGKQIQPLLDDIQAAYEAAMEGARLPAGGTDESEGWDWKKVMGNEGLLSAIERAKEAYPQLKELVEGIMAAFGVLPEAVEEEAKEGFSDLRGAFVSALMDMDGDAETFGKEIGRTMMEQMLDAYIDSKWKSQMAEVNQAWAEALESGNIAAMESVKIRLMELYNEMSNDVEAVNLSEAIKEMGKEADTTFLGMADSWASALMDMENTADDWAKDVGKTLAEKIVRELVVPTLIQPMLERMQAGLDAVFDRAGATWADVVNVAQGYMGEITQAYSEVQPLVEGILNSFGIFREEAEDAADAIEEVEYALGDLKNEFVSALMDMNNTAEDFANSIGKTLAQAFIEKFVLGEAFEQQMEAWQQRFEEINTSGLSEDERMRQVKQLRDAIAAAKEGYVEQSLAIQELLGLNNASDDQNATANIADKITYEQADELLGINMAQEMTLEQILATLKGGVQLGGVGVSGYSVTSQDALNQQILATLQGMQNATSVTGTSSDIFNRLGYTNEYLRAIRDSNQAMLDVVSGRLDQISARLARL